MNTIMNYEYNTIGQRKHDWKKKKLMDFLSKKRILHSIHNVTINLSLIIFKIKLQSFLCILTV